MGLFHLSFEDLGEWVTLKVSCSEERGKTEMETPHVSAAPSIEECIVALKSCERFQTAKDNNSLCLHVYEIESPEHFEAYSDVFDFCKTNEHISFSPEMAKKVGIVHIHKFKNMRYLTSEVEVKDANCVYEIITQDVFDKYYN